MGDNLRDEVDRVSANLFLSATPVEFLEAYLGIFSHSTSTNLPQPQLKQVVGDWNLGLKAFMPAEVDQIFTLGGALDLGFSTGSGQVGLSGIDSVNLGVRGLATADLSKRSSGGSRCARTSTWATSSTTRPTSSKITRRPTMC